MLFNSCKSILRWKAKKHNKKELWKQKINVILWAIENLRLGPLCSSE